MLLQPCPGSVELAHLVQVLGATSWAAAALMSVFRGCTVTRSLQQRSWVAVQLGGRVRLCIRCRGCLLYCGC